MIQDINETYYIQCERSHQKYNLNQLSITSKDAHGSARVLVNVDDLF